MTDEPKKFSLLGGLIAQQAQPKKESSNAAGPGTGLIPSGIKSQSPSEHNAAQAGSTIVAKAETNVAPRSLLGGTQANSVVNQTPPTRSLLGNVAQPDRTAVSVAKPSLLSNSLTQIARVEAEKKVAREQESDVLFKELPMDFKEVLDGFDAALVRDKGITDFNLDLVRQYVKRIMVDLKENPEFDGLIIDRDVHNIMKFIREVHKRAGIAVVEKKEKAATKEKKPRASKRFDLANMVLDLGALGDIDL